MHDLLRTRQVCQFEADQQVLCTSVVGGSGWEFPVLYFSGWRSCGMFFLRVHHLFVKAVARLPLCCCLQPETPFARILLALFASVNFRPLISAM